MYIAIDVTNHRRTYPNSFNGSTEAFDFDDITYSVLILTNNKDATQKVFDE